MTSGLIGAEPVAHVEPDADTLGAFNDAIVTMVPISRPGCALGHSDFERVFLAATVEWGLNRENEPEFSSACLRPRDFCDARAPNGRDASGERGQIEPGFRR